MTGINEASIASCYIDASALLIMFLLMILSEGFRKNKTPAMRVFRTLCLTLMATCVLSFISHAMYRQPAAWCHTLAVAARTLWMWSAYLTILLWAGYVEKKMYGNKVISVPVKAMYNLPFLLFTALLIVNLFRGIIFTCTPENQFEYTWLYYAIMFVEAMYLVMSMFRIRSYNKKAQKVCFIRVLPIALSIAVGASVRFFLACQADVLGYSIGVLLVYLSMAEELRCLDPDSGLYNLSFLSYLFDLAMAGKYDAHSALVLETTGNLQAGAEILSDTLHQDNDVIRVAENKYLMFSGERNQTALQFLITAVDEAVVKYNQEHPEETTRISARCVMRSNEDDPLAFLHSVRDEKEMGDEMRGVVSMISELDRLDNELKLAADIQINMLPMNFPPFPGRTEFSLYASMTPAKLVGGDFYDFFLIDDDHLALVIADVSGKGVPAALFMMVSKTLIKNQLMTGCDPAAALGQVNQQLSDRNSSMMFVTVWLAVLEISTGKGLACNAGHEKPALLRSGGMFELLTYKHDPIVGVRKKMQFHLREFEMHPGDCLFVYTDGVPEANNAAGKMFGEEQLLIALNREPGADPEELIRHVHGEVDRFADNAPQFDDITMLCFKYYGTENRKES